MLETLFIKLQAFRAASLLKRDSNIDIFSVKFVKFLRAPILKNVCERLLQNFHFGEKPHLLNKILGFMILQIRSKRQKQPSEVVL